MITADIIQDCQKGKEKAQKKVFTVFAGHMFNVCVRYVKDDAEAEDMVSQGFTKIFKTLKDFEYRDMNGLRAWIKKIMINECLMSLRKRNSLVLVSESEANDIPYNDKQLENMDAQYILSAISKLPVGYRTVLNLFIIEGYNHKEIADMLGIKEATSRSQLNKAKALLKEKIACELKIYEKRQF